MDQFSHDLTVALEETSLLDRARVSRWGSRRRTASTGNLPCAPQPTEDSSTTEDTNQPQVAPSSTNFDGLDTNNITLPSDSDEKEDAARLPCKSLNAAMRLGTLESDSLNETFSPARFFKPNARRKRKLKRISVEYEVGMAPNDITEPSNQVASVATGTIRKRLLKSEQVNRSNLFFCGKRKRSNRDRYHDHDHIKAHSSSMPRYTFMEEHRMRPRSYSSTSKPHSDRLLPLNKGLVSKIERISQLQKTDAETIETSPTADMLPIPATSPAESTTPTLEAQQADGSSFQTHRKKSSRSRHRRQLQQLQFAVDQHPMDCGELNDFLSSSSLSSSDSEDDHTANDTDREGDDELTDWPGNEGIRGPTDVKFDPKRKVLKKLNAPQTKAEADAIMLDEEDATLITSGMCDWSASGCVDPAADQIEMRYQPSQPITITGRSFALNSSMDDVSAADMSIPLKQIESEMSGETSNPFLSSPPCQSLEVREIRAGCRRIKGERPGFSIKTSVNERLARFLQDPRQIQIRLPDIEIYEHESLINLATLYSLQMSLDNGCAVLTKTSNTTQSVNIDQQSLQSRLLLSDFKRRCYDSKGSIVPRK